MADASAKETLYSPLLGRLGNWKFTQALRLVEAENGQRLEMGSMLNSEIMDGIRALSRAFGNSGWFDGDLGTIVSFAEHSLRMEIESLGSNK